ncbi:MAG: AI-2E family transporter [Eubacteriales bacterium]|nr:AI-2E family transporter [Eubacteriales bacterium]
MKDFSLKKNIILLIAAAALLAAALNIHSIVNGIFHVLGLAMPVIIGGVIAFILNVPMKAYEKVFFKLNIKLKRKMSEEHIRSISLLLAIISLVLVIVLVCVLAIPEIVSSLVGLYEQIVKKIPEFSTYVSQYISQDKLNELMDISWLQEQFSTDKITSLITNISSGTLDIVGRIFTFITSAAGTVFSLCMSFVVAIYMLLSKRKLETQTKKLLYAYFNRDIADHLCHAGQLINDTYAKFLSGQCIEAFIIAILIFIAFSIAKLPYAALVAVLAAVLSFIPYIGSFLACFIGAVLILFISPWQAVLSVIIYQIIQFLEGQFIYPHVVGNSVGLPAFYTFLAALLGGSLFGIVGIIFFIPLFAVIYTLIKESAEIRLAKKGVNI